MIRLLVLVIAVCLAVLLYLNRDSDYIWLILNQKDAEQIANAYFNGEAARPLPDKFVDHTIIFEATHVLFGTHNQRQVSYLFVPDNLEALPSELGPISDWQKLKENWYVRGSNSWEHNGNR